MSKKSSPIGIIIFSGIFLFFVFVGQCDRCMKKQKYKKYSTTNYKNGKYSLTFSEKFNKGNAIKSELGISVLIAVDCSGSMDDYLSTGSDNLNYKSSEEKKYVIASRALTKIINFLEDFYRKKASKEGLILKIGLLKFSSEVTVVSKILKMNLTNFTRLRQITINPDNFYPEGATAIGETLEIGAEMLAQSGTIFKSFIVITDGENTDGVDPDEVLKAIVTNNNNKSTEDFPIYTDNILVSFVGFDIDQYVFEDLHKIGARVMSAGNKRELENVLKSIFLTDITNLE